MKKNLGMVVLAIFLLLGMPCLATYLILVGLASFVPIGGLGLILGIFALLGGILILILALIAGILLLLGR